ncbi:MAG TPA: S9 family peptidase, partial [Candidatus Binatia bacterium]|nr:S9 family peptidase [Candidatus Binatia bacterium]
MFSSTTLKYPETRKVVQVDDYHGTKVADPYRWLEDDYATETKAWIEAQNKITFAYLESIPQRERIKARLTELWNYERYGVPFKEAGRYFYTKNDGLQNQSVLYTMDALDSPGRILLDPNKLSADGTVSLAGVAVSQGGNLMAYGTSAGGTDWQEWHVREIATGEDRPDLIQWVKTSHASWAKDAKGFFYSRYDEPASTNKLKGVNYFQKLYYHNLGTPQAEDALIYHRPDQKEWGFGGNVTDDGNYLIITVWQGTHTRNRLFYKDLQTPDSKVVELLNDFDADYTFIDNVGTKFFLRTDLDAPRGRVIAIDVTQPERRNWKEIIPQTANRLQAVNLVNDQFIADYLKDAHSEIQIFSLNGQLVRRVELPGIGSAGGFGGKRRDTETFYAFTSFTTPTTIYRYDVRNGKSEVFR